MLENIRPTLSPEELITWRTFDTIAHMWSQDADPTVTLPYLEKLARLLPGNRVLEIGCGSGVDIQFFADSDIDYVGIDISAGMLNEARKRAPSARLAQMNMYSLAFEPDTFDGLWAPAALYHIPKANIGLVLQEIHRVMKNGAVGFMAMIKGDSETLEDSGYGNNLGLIVRWSGSKFTKTLREAGFRVLSSKVKNPHIFFYVRAEKNQ